MTTVNLDLPDAEALFNDLKAQMAPAIAYDAKLVGVYSGGAWLADRLAAERISSNHGGPNLHIAIEGAKLGGSTSTGVKKMGNQININRPSTRIVIASAIVALLALVGHFSRVQLLTEYQFALAMISYGVLLLGVLFKGL